MSLFWPYSQEEKAYEEEKQRQEDEKNRERAVRMEKRLAEEAAVRLVFTHFFFLCFLLLFIIRFPHSLATQEGAGGTRGVASGT